MVEPRATTRSNRSRRDRRLVGTLARLALTVSMALVGLIALETAASAQTIGAGGLLYFDEGEMVGERRISVQTTDLGFEFGNDSFVAGSLWMLFDVSDTVRIGPAYRFFGSWDLTREDLDEDDDNRVREMGWLMDFDFMLDWVLPMTSDFDFLLGGQAGLVLLVPTGDFQAQIDDLQDQGVGVIGGPRLGYVVGPHVGMKWNINEMFAVRSDFGVRWQQLWLFTTEENVGGTPFGIDQRADILRYEIDLGVEVGF